jgi:Tail tubular protein
MPGTPPLLTELEAVNVMLSVIGEAPVNTLEGAATVDVIQAKAVLQQVSREVQSVGWHFNTERDYPFLPDVNGEVVLAANMVLVDADTEPDVDIAQRGNKLYDRKNHTFQFKTGIKAEVIYLLAFEDLPQVARQFITIRASRIFQDRMVGSETLHGYTEMDEKKALADLKELEGDTGDYTIFDHWDVYRTLDR